MESRIFGAVCAFSLVTTPILATNVFAATWLKTQPTAPQVAPFHFGVTASISGDTAMVGTPFDDVNCDGDNVGAVHVCHRSGTQSDLKQRLTAADSFGHGMDFGHAISIDGDVAVIGALRVRIDGQQTGSAYIFRYDGTSWIEEQKLVASNESTGQFGIAVTVSGEVVIAGTWADDVNGRI